MIEGLIEFMEASVFTRISRILEEEPSAEGRCRNLVAAAVVCRAEPRLQIVSGRCTTG
jgi:TetR/AcrR family transcriptional regulator